MTWRSIILLVCAGAVLVVLIGLGNWQMRRLAWKEAMIERVERGLAAAPVDIATARDLHRAGEDLEYRPAVATGTFLHDGEAHYFATFKGRNGWFVYTPLRQSDGRILMVNRGFVEGARKDPSTRPEGQTEGEVTITGLLRTAPAEKPNPFVANNDLAKNVFHWKSLNQMASMGTDKMEVALEPFFLDAGPDTPTVGAGPVGGVTRVTFSNNHLGYAFTWYGLAASLVGVGLFFAFSRRNASKRQA